MIGVGLVNAFVFGVYGTILNSIQAAHGKGYVCS